MRPCTLALIVLTTVLFCTEFVNAAETCPEENCVTAEKCKRQMSTPSTCNQTCTLCCSVVKKRYRTHCRHYGGECLDKMDCGIFLGHGHETVDCPGRCCVFRISK